MARDPPTTSSSSSFSSHTPSPSYTSELSDLTTPTSPVLHPTYILPLRITTIHPQLRDLIVCPQERGKLFYVMSKGVGEVGVEVGRRGRRRAGVEGGEDGRAEGEGGDVPPKFKTSTLSTLKFTPNCLAASSTILAAGGQFGELHLTSLPPLSSSPSPSAPYIPHPFPPSSSTEYVPWTLTTTLPHTSINNSFLLLPPYRAERERENLRGRARGVVRSGERSSPIHTRESSPCAGAGAGAEVGRGNGIDSRDRDVRGHIYARESDGDGRQTTGLGIATGPNTLPASPRDRERGPPAYDPREWRRVPSNHLDSDGGFAYSSSSPAFINANNPDRGQATSPGSTSTRMRREPGRRLIDGRVEYVDPMLSGRTTWGTTRIRTNRAERRTEEEVWEEYIEAVHGGVDAGGDDGGVTGWPFVTTEEEEVDIDWEMEEEEEEEERSHPRDFIGRDDREHPSTRLSRVVYQDRNERHPEVSDDPADHDDSLTSSSSTYHQPSNRSAQRDRIPIIVTSPHRGSGRPSPAHPSGIHPYTRTARNANFCSGSRCDGRYDRPLTPLEDEPRLLVSNNDMSVKMFAIRGAARRDGAAMSGKHAIPGLLGGSRGRPGERLGQPYLTTDVASACAGGGQKLSKIGGTRLTTAVNHSSMSPDGKQMLVVGDTTTVYVYNVLGGGKEFVKVGEFEGSNDAGFSTSWSKDGRKFAVASQDGQVTVWDHRSSHALAKLFTKPVSSPRSRTTPSFSGDLTTYWDMLDAGGYHDTLDGISATGTVRRDPARVVKFSPEGSDRDILVFSEEHDNIHVVDARTFDAVLTLPVPYEVPLAGSNALPLPSERPRRGTDGGRPGISGLCFDPTGNFVYSGTEATIVEWDLRSSHRRGLGSSAIA